MIGSTSAWRTGFCALAMGITGVLLGCQPSDPATSSTSSGDQARAGSGARPTPAEPSDGAASATDGGAGRMGTTGGLPPVPVPEDNPMTAEKVELGMMLFFDKRLSRDGTISCATCHDPAKAWADGQPTSTGIDGQVGARNAPTVINAAFAEKQFWDGRAESLEDQVLEPIENPIEMGHTLTDLVSELNQIPDYHDRFQRVFGTEVTAEGIAKAIATFERTIVSDNSPYDRFRAGDQSALTEAQKRGLRRFDEAKCGICHSMALGLFSNYRFYNAGVGTGSPTPDEGRMGVTRRGDHRGTFRVPSLREVAHTAPYFHDGSATTLDDAVALMAGGGVENPRLSPMLKSVGRCNLTEQDRKDIVEFLQSLSGQYPVVEPPPLP